MSWKFWKREPKPPHVPAIGHYRVTVHFEDGAPVSKPLTYTWDYDANIDRIHEYADTDQERVESQAREFAFRVITQYVYVGSFDGGPDTYVPARHVRKITFAHVPPKVSA